MLCLNCLVERRVRSVMYVGHFIYYCRGRFDTYYCDFCELKVNIYITETGDLESISVDDVSETSE